MHSGSVQPGRAGSGIHGSGRREGLLEKFDLVEAAKQKVATGVDAPDPANPDAEPYNIYRFNAMRVDAATGNYDMGFRNYSPQEGRFLTRDMYNGALSDLGMTTSPWTQNRYAFGAGNPISRIENDGHCWGFLSSACDAVGGAVSDAWNATTDWWSDTAQPWLEESIVEPVQETAAAATEAVGDAAEAVGDAAEATVDFVEEHKAEIAGIVAGIAVTAVCLVVTGGAGSIGCAALGGAAGSFLTGYMNGQRGLELVGTTVLGAATGALGGGVGSAIGGALGGVARGLGGRALGGLVSGARGAISGARGAITSVGSDLTATARSFGAGSLRRFAVGSFNNITAEAREKGLVGQARAIGADLLRGSVSPQQSLGPAVGAGLVPTDLDGLRSWPSFHPQNMIAPILTGGFNA